MKIIDNTTPEEITKLKGGMFFIDTTSRYYYICVVSCEGELHLHDLVSGEQYNSQDFDGYNLGVLEDEHQMKLIVVKEMILK